MSSEQVELFSEYRDRFVEGVRSHALQTAARGDPEGFDLAIWAIRRLALEEESFSADDVRGVAHIGSNATGAALAYLRREREIEVVGFTTSRIPSRHGAAIRLWRRA